MIFAVCAANTTRPRVCRPVTPPLLYCTLCPGRIAFVSHVLCRLFPFPPLSPAEPGHRGVPISSDSAATADVATGLLGRTDPGIAQTGPRAGHRKRYEGQSTQSRRVIQYCTVLYCSIKNGVGWARAVVYFYTLQPQPNVGGYAVLLCVDSCWLDTAGADAK